MNYTSRSSRERDHRASRDTGRPARSRGTSVMVATFTVAGQAVMCSDSFVSTGSPSRPRASLSRVRVRGEVARLAVALAEGGAELRPLGKTVQPPVRLGNDRFGVSWQLNMASGGQFLTAGSVREKAYASGWSADVRCADKRGQQLPLPPRPCPDRLTIEGTQVQAGIRAHRKLRYVLPDLRSHTGEKTQSVDRPEKLGYVRNQKVRLEARVNAAPLTSRRSVR